MVSKPLKQRNENITCKCDIEQDYNSFSSDKSSIDSLKIRIPISQVNITSDILNDEFALVSKRTGEIFEDESFKKSAYFSDNKGIKTYYRKEQQVNKGGSKEFLTILLSSKTLKHNYFSGITKNTLHDVYEYICDDEVIKVGFDEFCLAECTDIDIKCDVVPKVQPELIIKDLYDRAIPKKLAIEACSVYGIGKRSMKNLGVQFALRKTSKFRTAPYLKFYEKIRELKYKSVEFSNNYIPDFKELPSNILRAETTIKNKDHLKYLNSESNTFINLCDNIDKLAVAAFKHSMTCHLSNHSSLDYSNKLNPKKVLKPVPLDFYIRSDIQKEMSNGFSYRQAVERTMLFHSVTKHQKYFLKKRIAKLEDFGFIGSDLGFKKGSVDDYLNFMGF